LEVGLFWSNSSLRENKLQSHTLDAKELEILAEYPLEILNTEDKVKVCLLSKNSGFFHAALLVKQKGSSFGIGAWISLEVDKVKPSQLLEYNPSRVIGSLDYDRIVLKKQLDSKSSQNKETYFVPILICFVLLITLSFLALKLIILKKAE
jgi:hypothetical protein